MARDENPIRLGFGLGLKTLFFEIFEGILSCVQECKFIVMQVLQSNAKYCKSKANQSNASTAKKCKVMQK